VREIRLSGRKSRMKETGEDVEKNGTRGFQRRNEMKKSDERLQKANPKGHSFRWNWASRLAR